MATVEVERFGNVMKIGDFRKFEAEIIVFGRLDRDINAPDLLID